MFLFKRPNSNNWQLELRFPKDFEFTHLTFALFGGRRHFTMSLGTSDRAEAEIKAADYIQHYRVAIYQWKALLRGGASRNTHPPLQFRNGREYEDGLQTIDGQQAVVSGQSITFFDPRGKPTKTVINPSRLIMHAPRVEDTQTASAVLYFDPNAELPKRYMPEKKNPDDEIIEAYIKAKRLSAAIAADTRSTWALYCSRIGKPLSKATRKDGKVFAESLQADGLKRATVQKKVGWLAAACAYEIAEDGLLSNNPFHRVLPPPGQSDSLRRRPFSEEQMATCFRQLQTISVADQLLWKLLAKTGMRLGEAMSIRREFSERGSGIRYVEVGTKTDSSRRNVPLPLDIGLPGKIERPLFLGTASAASKRLNRFIKGSLPDWTPDLVVHSLRHRAVDVFRLHSKDIDPFLRRRLLGHAAADVHDRYGSFGPPMGLLKPLIDGNPIDGSLTAEHISGIKDG